MESSESNLNEEQKKGAIFPEDDEYERSAGEVHEDPFKTHSQRPDIKIKRRPKKTKIL